MSSIFSDPPFRRGTTLAAGDFGDAATSGVNILGGELVGQIKAFQDVDPSTGQRYSNRLVYCQAVRWTGSNVSDASSIAGFLYTVSTAFENGKPFCTIGTLTNAATDLPTGDIVVLDEYLTGQLNTNDVVWVVVKGPTAPRQTGVAILNGALVTASGSAGQVAAATVTSSVATNPIGASIHGSATAATNNLKIRVNMFSNRI